MSGLRGSGKKAIDTILSPQKIDVAYQKFVRPSAAAGQTTYPSSQRDLKNLGFHFDLSDHTRQLDLSLANILLVPGSTKIASVIDWQDASIFPLFMQAGCYPVCEHDSSRPQSLQIPGLPKGLDKMKPQDQIQIKTKFRLEEMNMYYTAATGIHNEEHMEALRIPHLSMQQYLIQQTGYPWDGDVINLRAALVGITTSQVWSTISALPCPVSFSDKDREKALKESSEWNESEALLTAVKNDLGIDLEGGTEVENYDWASSRNLQFRREMLRQAEVHERESLFYVSRVKGLSNAIWEKIEPFQVMEIRGYADVWFARMGPSESTRTLHLYIGTGVLDEHRR
ncbi:hypothetical protein CISG_07334 [Coccidioides immitis RMSCC 3703]|uniref:Aminoglycoside phosphotransferase domain-containing protein n=1 Tax=Coccidioides immitis RMSCC 3703 TaxID=454286 RepID=A0A0J8TYH0_COCIT|nr:hypothetical protein CISG_07334 [Coccidioides immitis RMSCC 3703]